MFELGEPPLSVENNLVWSYCMKPQRTATAVSAVGTPVPEKFQFLFVFLLVS